MIEIAFAFSAKIALFAAMFEILLTLHMGFIKIKLFTVHKE